MKTTALFISLLLLSQVIYPLQTFRTKSSGIIPVDVDIQDVTPIYSEIDPNLFYYKISVRNNSLDYKTRISFQTISQLGYKQANSQAWSSNFWLPFYYCEGAILGSTLLVAAVSQNKESAKLGIGLALLALFIQSCRHNKAADLKSRIIVPEAYIKISAGPTQRYKVPGIFVNKIEITQPGILSSKKVSSCDSMVFSTTMPLFDILIDINQMGSYYEISLIQ